MLKTMLYLQEFSSPIGVAYGQGNRLGEPIEFETFDKKTLSKVRS